MKFYNKQHKYYCGIDLHARKMYVCILDRDGKMIVHQNIKTDPDEFINLIKPYMDDIVVGVECKGGRSCRACIEIMLTPLYQVFHRMR